MCIDKPVRVVREEGRTIPDREPDIWRPARSVDQPRNSGAWRENTAGGASDASNGPVSAMTNQNSCEQE